MPSGRQIDLEDRGARRPGQLEPVPSAGAARPEAWSTLASAEDFSLVDQLWTIVGARWLVLGVVAVALGAGVAYLFVTPPVYRSDVLLQIEERKKTIPGITGFDEAPVVPVSDSRFVDAEMEIIRSRGMVGAVVERLNLGVEAAPRTFPIFGAAVARHRAGAALAAAPRGLGRYAWGGERIDVAQLSVPAALVDQPLTLTAAANGRYTLSASGVEILSGEVGQKATAGDESARVTLFVAELAARPGTEFVLAKRRALDVTESLQRRLEIVERAKGAGILSIALEGPDPARIAEILDALADAYLRQNVERKSAEAEKTLEFLTSQLPVLKGSVDAAESALNEYQHRTGNVDVGLETRGVLDRAGEVEKALSDIEMQRAELKRRFTDDHPSLLALDQKAIHLRAERERINRRLGNLPGAEMQLARLLRDRKVANELYVAVLNKTQEYRVVKSGTVGNVRILDRATVAVRPVKPRRGTTLAVAIVVGLIAGAALAVTRKQLLGGVEGPEEAESTTGLPVYATIPHSERQAELDGAHRGRAGPRPILAVAHPDDLAVENLRSLRTSLQFALLEARNNVINITGPSPGVGKSFVSVNLAHVLAATERRVLLVDADLRRGRLHGALGGERGPGLSELVCGAATIDRAVRRSAVANLDYLPTGKLPPNPSELLATQRFQVVLAELSGRYDLLVVDTPPILAVTDAALVGRIAGVNLLLLKSGEHSVGEVVAALKRLWSNGVRAHGLVVNDMRRRRRAGPRGGDYYRYEYRPLGGGGGEAG